MKRTSRLKSNGNRISLLHQVSFSNVFFFNNGKLPLKSHSYINEVLSPIHKLIMPSQRRADLHLTSQENNWFDTLYMFHCIAKIHENTM